MPNIEFPDTESNGLIHCTCCGKNDKFGRVDVIKQEVHTKLTIFGECGECLDKKADAAESAKVKELFANAATPPASTLTQGDNQDVKPNLTPTAPGSQESPPQ